MTYLTVVYFVLTLASIYKALVFLVKKNLRAKLTAIDDIPLLGQRRADGRKIPGTAVICGGSISGLLSARVCSDHFEQVLIVEPEAWVSTEEGQRDRHHEPSGPKRSRVAQYTSVHGYQCLNLIALRKLFPGCDDDLKGAGARILPADLALHVAGIRIPVPHYKYPEEGLPKSMYFTRAGYETSLRRMVLSMCSNVEYVTGSVSGLVPHSTTNTVASVGVRTPDETSIEIPAAIVVDCTGPATGGFRWLQETRFPTDLSAVNKRRDALPLSELRTSYEPKLSYTSCGFDIPPDLHDKIKNVVLPCDYESDANLYFHIPRPPDRRTMFVSRREGNFLQLFCGGYDIRLRIACVDDIREHISKFTPIRPIPQFIFALLDLLEEADVPATYVNARVPPSVYVQYCRALRLPSNFVAIGDAIMQANPIRGQGCTKACIDVITLNACLARWGAVRSREKGAILPSNFSRTFFAAQEKRTGKLWKALKSGDYAVPTTIPTPGDDPKTYGAWGRWYNSKVAALMTKDREIASVLWHVANFLAPSTDLFSPWIVAKVIWIQLTLSFSIMSTRLRSLSQML